MKQLHEKDAQTHQINPFVLMAEEKKKAMESFVFMIEKTDGRMKSRTVANGSMQQPCTDEDQTVSPTTSVEATLITAAIDANEIAMLQPLTRQMHFCKHLWMQKKAKEL